MATPHPPRTARHLPLKGKACELFSFAINSLNGQGLGGIHALERAKDHLLVSFFILAQTFLKCGLTLFPNFLYAQAQHFSAFWYSPKSQYAAATETSNVDETIFSPYFLFA